MSCVLYAIRYEAIRVYRDAMLSAQAQFEYSKRWRHVDRWIGGMSAVLAGVSGVTGLGDLLPTQTVGAIAIAAAVLAAIATTVGAPSNKLRAYTSANAFLALQEDARVFLLADLPLLEVQPARQALDDLVKRHQRLQEAADIPPGRTWNRAGRHLLGQLSGGDDPFLPRTELPSSWWQWNKRRREVIRIGTPPFHGTSSSGS
jgi:hypothetical protein